MKPVCSRAWRTAQSPDGAAVLVDYTVTAGCVEDDLVDQAITEAEDIILRSLAEEYNASSTNQGLKTGATELALSIICRALSHGSAFPSRHVPTFPAAPKNGSSCLASTNSRPGKRSRRS